MLFTVIDDSELPLQRAYRWERERAHEVFLTQPVGAGEVRDFTWAQAMREARCVAAWLRSLQLPPGSRVAIMAKNSAWWFMSDLAIWMAGHVSVPVYPNLVAASVRQIMEHAGVSVAVVGKLDDAKAMMAGVPEKVVVLCTPGADEVLCAAAHAVQKWAELVAQQAPITDHPAPSAQTPATIIYTSGTTGTPKGAVHAFASFAHGAKALAQLIGSTAHERALSYLPLAHVAERCLVEAHAFHLGFRVYFCRSLTTFVTDLQRARPTFFFSVPRMWLSFQQGVMAKMPTGRLDRLLAIPIVRRFVGRKVLKQLGLDSVRFAGTGAAPLPPEVTAWYRRLGLELLEGYGMTEQFALAANNVPGRSRVGYVGEPSGCCEIRLSEDGEVLTRGPAHQLGYFEAPEATALAVTPDGWLKTGDKGEFDDQGRLRIVGRVKEQFKTSKGKYVAPAPIEALLSAFTQVEAFMVCGQGCPQPYALATLPQPLRNSAADETGREAFGTALRAHLKRTNAALDPHERLDFIAVVPEQWSVESGFVTPTLKLKRTVIERHYSRHFDAWAAQRKPVVWHGN